MTSTDFTPTKVYLQNNWTVKLVDERVYLIIDAKGNQCRTNSVRVINADEIAIGHPLVPDVRVNTRKLKSLPAHCIGDLLDPQQIEAMRDNLVDSDADWNGRAFRPDFQRDRVRSGHFAYHGSNFPDG